MCGPQRGLAHWSTGCKGRHVAISSFRGRRSSNGRGWRISMRFQSSRFNDLLEKWFFFGHDRGHGCYQLNLVLKQKFSFLEQSLAVLIHAHWAQKNCFIQNSFTKNCKIYIFIKNQENKNVFQTFIFLNKWVVFIWLWKYWLVYLFYFSNFYKYNLR